MFSKQAHLNLFCFYLFYSSMSTFDGYFYCTLEPLIFLLYATFFHESMSVLGTIGDVSGLKLYSKKTKKNNQTKPLKIVIRTDTIEVLGTVQLTR